jgi:hypothetical protein
MPRPCPGRCFRSDSTRSACRSPRWNPARRRDRGSKGKGGRGGGGSPGLHKRTLNVRVSGVVLRAEGRSPRPVPDLPGLHPCRREGGALSSQKKGVWAAAKRRSVGSRETGEKGTRRRISIAPPGGGTRDRVPPARDTLSREVTPMRARATSAQ